MSYTCSGRGDCERCRINPAWRHGCRSQLKGVFTHAMAESAIKSFGPQDLLPGESIDARDGYGIALDVGTTTLAAALIELRTGTVLATVSAANPQMLYGSDVMSRIAYVREKPAGLEQLHALLVSEVNAMIGDLIARAAVPNDVREIVVVGNPTMLHTLVRADVTPLGEAPFEGVMRGAWRGLAGDLKLAVNTDARVWCPPVIHSHVGADLLASLVATGIDRDDELTLLIDLGTNTELALASRTGVTVTSASGGPAFEAGSIRCGMRAIPGAIDQLRIDRHGRIRVHTVGRAAPIGICGSGLLDAVAEMLRVGLVEPSGRMCSAAELPAELAALQRRILQHGSTRSLWIAGPLDDPVLISADDVRQLQLVKASIASAATLLLDHTGHVLEDVARIYVAGAFGNYISETSAQAVGLLPRIDNTAVRFVGHTAGMGARMMLVSPALRERAMAIADKCSFVDLAGHDEYQTQFVEALPFRIAETAGV